MSQNWVANLYTTGTVVDTTMSNVELMFATLKSSFSGTSAPGNTVAGQVWYDSNASYKCLQVRDSGDAAWRGIMAGSSANKVWLYLNAVEEGWTIDSSVTDKVLAFKGGATYTTGADSAGSWTVSGLTKDAHTHPGTGTLTLVHTHTVSHQTWGQKSGEYEAGTLVVSGDLQANSNKTTSGASNTTVDGSTGDQSDAGVTHTPGWRISAAVGIMAAPKARG